MGNNTLTEYRIIFFKAQSKLYPHHSDSNEVPIMIHRDLSPAEIDAAVRQAEAIRSAYIAGACKSMVTRIRNRLGDREAARNGLAASH